jgi:hypothetical protein
MKIRVVKRPKQSEEISSERPKTFIRSNQFLDSYRKYEYSTPQLRSFLYQEYKRVFPNKVYPEGQSLVLVRMAIGYELVVQDYKENGFAIPEAVKQNHEAALNFDISKFAEPIRGTLKYQIQNQGENETMKTKKAVLVKKAPKLSPEAKAEAGVKEKKVKKEKVRGNLGLRYIEIFGSGKKLSNERISEMINKEFGKNHTPERVAVYRSLYNSGRIAGQKEKPKNPSIEG